MATTDDKKRAFVDTNVLLRTINDGLTDHQQALALVDRMWADDIELWVSRQVLREYVVQVTRPGFLDIMPSLERVMSQMEMIQSLFRVVDETVEVTRQRLELLKVYPTGGKQIHDSNIVATMLVNDIETLLTQNVADMKRFSTKITVVPLN